MKNNTVFIVDDEPKITQIIEDFLRAEGFDTEVLHDGEHAVEKILGSDPALVILDLMLPNKDGLTICKEIRQESIVPIIMLTARVDEIDRLLGLNLGADDYVCKPFSAREIVARVKAILRRVEHLKETKTDSGLSYKNISIDLDRYQCKVSGQIVNFTPVEFRLLAALVERPGTVMSRDKLMNKCYEDERVVSDRTIDSHMKNLRSKLNEAIGADEQILHSVYGVGYKVE